MTEGGREGGGKERGREGGREGGRDGGKEGGRIGAIREPATLHQYYMVGNPAKELMVTGMNVM